MKLLSYLLLFTLVAAPVFSEVIELSPGEVAVPGATACSKFQYPVFKITTNGTAIGIPKSMNEWAHYTILADVDTVISGWIMLIGIDPVLVNIDVSCEISVMIVCVVAGIGLFSLGIITCTIVCLCRCTSCKCCKKDTDHVSLYEDDDSITPLPKHRYTKYK